jgi:recombination protein RecA
MSDLDNAISELNKKFGKNSIISGAELAGVELSRVSSGSLSLDIETGGGFPYGRLVELFGKESCGKSYVAQKTVGNVQKEDKKAVWIDAEGSFDPSWATLLGVDVKNLYLSRPQSGEEAGDILDGVIQSGDCGIVVLDSVAALIPNADLEKAMDEVEQMGARAKMVNRLMRKLHSALNMQVGEDKVPNDCLVIFINQIREKIGVMYGNPETTGGGWALKFGASIRVKFTKSWIKDGEDQERVIGQTVKCITEKNKTYPPMRHGEFNLYTDGPLKGQIDLATEVFTYGQLSGLINLSGKTYTVGNNKYVGKETCIEALRADSKLVESFKAKILDHYFKRGR